MIGRLLLVVVLVLTAVLLPPAATRAPEAELVRVQSGDSVDAANDVVWILALGSDARPGQPVLRSRADAIQLVGMNVRTGAATVIGIPRDSYVDVPGYGRNKINSAMLYGGPQLMARSVAGMVGLTPDYVFTTSFLGLQAMVKQLDGVTVYSPFSWSLPVATVRRGKNRLNGAEALAFARMRYELPRGDFDRSLDQGLLLLGGLRRVREVSDQPGTFERLVASFLANTDIDLPPAELYRLARAVLQVQPSKVTRCVVPGRTGSAGAASVVFPDVGKVRSWTARARADAALQGGC